MPPLGARGLHERMILVTRSTIACPASAS
jgi:hypothetical protein